MIVFTIAAFIVGLLLPVVAVAAVVPLTYVAFASIGEPRDALAGWEYNLILIAFCVVMPLSGFLMDWSMGASGSKLFSGAYGLGAGALAVTLILASAYWGTRGVRLILALRGSAWCGR